MSLFFNFFFCIFYFFFVRWSFFIFLVIFFGVLENIVLICKLESVCWVMVYCCFIVCKVLINVVFFKFYCWFVMMSVFWVLVSFKLWFLVWCNFNLVCVKLVWIEVNIVLYFIICLLEYFFFVIILFVVFLNFCEFCRSLYIFFLLDKFNLLLFVLGDVFEVVWYNVLIFCLVFLVIFWVSLSCLYRNL